MRISPITIRIWVCVYLNVCGMSIIQLALRVKEGPCTICGTLPGTHRREPSSNHPHVYHISDNAPTDHGSTVRDTIVCLEWAMDSEPHP